MKDYYHLTLFNILQWTTNINELPDLYEVVLATEEYLEYKDLPEETITKAEMWIHPDYLKDIYYD